MDWVWWRDVTDLASGETCWITQGLVTPVDIAIKEYDTIWSCIPYICSTPRLSEMAPHLTLSLGPGSCPLTECCGVALVFVFFPLSHIPLPSSSCFSCITGFATWLRLSTGAISGTTSIPTPGRASEWASRSAFLFSALLGTFPPAPLFVFRHSDASCTACSRYFAVCPLCPIALQGYLPDRLLAARCRHQGPPHPL